MNIRQRGMALLEVLAALAIGAIMLIGLTSMIDTTVQDTQGQVASLYQAQVVAAATQYINSNYASLQTSATASNPVVVNLAQLTNPASGAPYLAPNTAATNPYGQTSCVLILQPALGEFNALVVSYGGQAIPDANLSMVAANSGAGGGYISNANSTAAQGSSWSLNTTALQNFQSPPCLTGSAADGGHLASAIFFSGPGQLSTDFLYRSAVPGRQELNTMQTPLLFGSGTIATEGTTCGTSAAIAFDASNNQLNCASNGLWTMLTSWWKSPVRSYADLPTTDPSGTVRLVTDVNRAFAYDASSGATWVPLAIDQNGNLTVPTNIEVQNGNLTVDQGNITATIGNLTVGNNGSFGNNVTVGYDLTALDGIVADTWTYSPGYTIGAVMAAGSPCNYTDGRILPDGTLHILWPTGIIVKDANGIALSCYSDNTFHYENGTYAP